MQQAHVPIEPQVNLSGAGTGKLCPNIQVQGFRAAGAEPRRHDVSMLNGVTGSLAMVGGLARGLWLLRAHSRWMGINLGLALVPLVLAVGLFRGRRARGVLWWAGVLVFLAFLPNAPYVLTDVVHLHGDVRAAGSRRAAVFGVLPLYGLFILIGMESYTICVRLLRQYLTRAGWRRKETVVIVAVHLVCAVGVVVGRVQRLNTWDILRPSRFAGGVEGAFTHPLLIGATAVAVVVGSISLEWVTVTCGHLVLRGARHS